MKGYCIIYIVSELSCAILRRLLSYGAYYHAPSYHSPRQYEGNEEKTLGQRMEQARHLIVAKKVGAYLRGVTNFNTIAGNATT